MLHSKYVSYLWWQFPWVESIWSRQINEITVDQTRLASLPFRAQSFQKANLPCIIMSACDLGQALFNALVLLETLAEEGRQNALFWSLCCSSSPPLECSPTPTAGDLQLSLPAHCSSIAVGEVHAEPGRRCWRRRAAQSCVQAHKLITSETLQTLTAGEVASRVCACLCFCARVKMKNKVLLDDNAQRRRKSVVRELHDYFSSSSG